MRYITAGATAARDSARDSARGDTPDQLLMTANRGCFERLTKRTGDYERQLAGLYLSAIVPLSHFQVTVLLPFNTG